MKRFIFKNKIMIILYILLGIYYAYCWTNTLFTYNGKEILDSAREEYKTCENIYLNKYELEEKKNTDSLDRETCEKILSYGTPAGSAYNVFETFFTDEKYLFPFFMPIIILIPFLYNLSKELKSKYVKSYTLRKDYKQYRLHIFKEAYKNIFVFPLIVLLTFLISCIVSHWNFNAAADIGWNYVLPNMGILQNKFNIFMYIITLFLTAGIYINIGLIILRNNKNFLVSIIESQLAIFLMWGIVTVAMAILFFKGFGINQANFNILNIVNWYGVDNFLVFFLVNLILFLVTSICAWMYYKNKEKFIIMCEK